MISYQLQARVLTRVVSLPDLLKNNTKPIDAKSGRNSKNLTVGLIDD